MGDLFLLMPSMSSSHCLFEQFAGTVTHQCQPDSSWDRFLVDLLLKAGTLTRLISIFKILSFCQFSSYKNFIIWKIHQNSTRNSMQQSDLASLCCKTHSGAFLNSDKTNTHIHRHRQFEFKAWHSSAPACLIYITLFYTFSIMINEDGYIWLMIKLYQH